MNNLNNSTTTTTTTTTTTNELTTSEKLEFVLDILSDYNLIEESDRYLITEVAESEIDCTKSELLGLYEIFNKITNFDGLEQDHIINIMDFATDYIYRDFDELIEKIRNDQLYLFDSKEEVIETYVGSRGFDLWNDLTYFIDNDVINEMFKTFVYNCSCSGEADFIEASDGTIIEITY